MKGQLACPEVAAGQQLMARRGGGDPDPGVPALALGAWPAERTSQHGLSLTSRATASAQASFVAPGSVIMKSEATRNT
jgi:hypothetical protein